MSTTRTSLGAGTNTHKSKKCARTHSANKQQQRRYVTQEQVFGGKFSPSPNPPDVIFLPWNRVTLVIPFSGTYTVTVTELKEKLRKQCDPTGRGFNPLDTTDRRFVPSFKLSSYQVWNLTGHLISMSVQDFTDTQSAKGGRDQLAGIVDTGAPGLLPKAGYKLPASHRNHVLRSDDVETLIEVLVIQVGSGDQGLLYVNLEYRFDGTAQLPQTRSLFDLLSKCTRKVNQIEAAAHVTSIKTTETANLAAQILSSMPTTSVRESDQPNSPLFSDALMEQLRITQSDDTEYDQCSIASGHDYDH